MPAKILLPYPLIKELSRHPSIILPSGVLKLFVFTLFLLASQVLSAADQAASPQEKLIRDLYASFCTDRLWFQPKEMEKFIKKSLLRDMVQAEKADLYLDLGCPFAPSQDPDYKEIARTLTVKQESASTVVATFDNYGKKAKVVYKCEKLEGQWRVADILEEFDGQSRSFAKALSRALAQHSP